MIRDIGYYWVKDNRGWHVALWQGNKFILPDTYVNNGYPNSWFVEINENRIKSPIE